MKSLWIAGLIACALPGAAVAQTAAAEPAVTQPDAAQLAAAAGLMDVLMPPSQRDAMIDNIVNGMLQTIFSSLSNQPHLKALLESEPRARPVFERFLARQRALAGASMRDNMPGLIDAMTIAYARRFTLGQMAEMERFFRTPTGQAYVAQAGSIMNDPAVASWQQRVMTQDLARSPDEIARLQREMAEALGQ